MKRPYGQQNPQCLPTLGISIPFWRGGLILRLVAIIVSVQPFAYVIGNYTCHNGESERYKNRIKMSDNQTNR